MIGQRYGCSINGKMGSDAKGELKRVFEKRVAECETIKQVRKV
jgi:hypothetical protein